MITAGGVSVTNLSPDHEWHRILELVARRGVGVGPRGMPTLEVVGLQSAWIMADPVIKSVRRKLGYRYMAAEAAWVLSGDNRLSSIGPYSSIIDKFSDDGVRFFGAYGPRVVDQLRHVVQELKRDPDSRRAVINLWRDNPPESRDVPCTLSLQFLIRRHTIHCVSTMRSNDVWLGTPYDVFTFSQVAAAVAIELRPMRLQLGTLIHTAGSHHVYERDLPRAHDVLSAGAHFANWSEYLSSMKMLDPHVFMSVDELVAHLWEIAKGNQDGLVVNYANELMSVPRNDRDEAHGEVPS